MRRLSTTPAHLMSGLLNSIEAAAAEVGNTDDLPLALIHLFIGQIDLLPF